MDFFNTLLDQLDTIAAKSRSIPAQMCGEAAEAIRKLLKEEVLRTVVVENEKLKEENRRLIYEMSLHPAARAPLPGLGIADIGHFVSDQRITIATSGDMYYLTVNGLEKVPK